MTKRQQKYWRARMVEIEKRMLGYYASERGGRVCDADGPDGSFAMSALWKGYDMAKREDRKK
jgi:hypothetical protein